MLMSSLLPVYLLPASHMLLVTRKYWSLPRHMGRRRTLGDLFITGCGQDVSLLKNTRIQPLRSDIMFTYGEIISKQERLEEKYTVIYPYTARDKDEINLDGGMTVEVIQKNLEGWWKIRYQGQEGWAPASYLKKADLLSQKLPTGCPAHSSASDLDGFSRQANAAKERDNIKTEACFSPFADVRRKSPDARHRPPPRRDLTIPKGLHLPKPPIPPQVEEEYYTIADFQTTIPDGISFQAGMKVEVIEKNSSGWWYIQIDEKEGWAPITFIDKYKKTSNATRPNFLAPLPNEMAQLRLENGTTSSIAHDDGREDWFSKPLPDDPSISNGLSAKPKLKDWKTKDAVKGIFPDNKAASSAFSGVVQTDPICPSVEEKPALPPRRESINKSLEVEFTEKQKLDPTKGLPPKLPAPGVILPMMPPKPAPFKGEKVPDQKKEEKNKVLYLRNEMGLECGHKVSAKEVKKFNLKPVAKPGKPKPEPSEEKPEPVGQMTFAKPKPQVRPKPIPAPRVEGQTESKVDITNLRSKLRPAKPTDKSFEMDISQQEAVNNSLNNVPSTSKGNMEPKIPPKQHNGHGQSDRPKGFPGKPVPEISTGETEPPKISVSKEAPQRPSVPPRRPPPPKQSSAPSSPTEAKGSMKDLPEVKPSSIHHRPGPPKPKALIPPPSKDESKLKGALGPKLLNKQLEKPDPPKEKLPSLRKEGDVPQERKYVAIADFEGDEQTSGFKEGTVFDVQEKNTSGWWFCKVASGGPIWEGWIPSNFLTKKQ
ncbi:SH3 and PX domain-containing protein 2B-like isoform X3 [Polyodon spathula]|uniref:SH3 and PX domain-containing protein 2B-like isoform X3 n=1 Tax=Polyodon spathula TaxID=7913 RepID=UPI001B7D97F0|nr:SH3 and PX domain-containing protein 2B-like isoform X3 [Polyodon spathula]